MFSNLKQRFLDKWFLPASGRPSRSTRRARLGLESLETREVLSATVPGFSLNNGNLYHTTGAQTQLIDTSVQSFTVVNNTVFDLHSNGMVQELNSDGSANTAIGSGVSSLVSDGTGNVFVVLSGDGSVWEHVQGSGWNWNQVGSGVSSLVSDATGNVFALLSSNGTVFEHVQGWTWRWSQVGSGVSSLVSDGTGNVFALLSGNGAVFEHVEGWGWNWSQVGSGVSSLVSDSTGSMFVLLAGNGAVFEHVEGWGWNWFQVGSGVSSMGSNNTGNVFVRLSGDSSVWEHVEGSGWNWTEISVPPPPLPVDPAAAGVYSPVSGSLFGSNGPSYLDVQQGYEGDCWLLSSLAEVAARAPSDIESMFTYEGTAVDNGSVVGLYRVRFYNSNGVAHYVTVDTELPDGGSYYDQPANGVLWVALAEKAYAEANGAGFVTSGDVGVNSYDALSGGYPTWALQAITGKSTGFYSIYPGNIPSAWNAGDLIVLCTPNSPNSPYILGDHCYALVGYNPSSSLPFELYNPWGITNSEERDVYGLCYADADGLSENFYAQAFGVGAAVGVVGHNNGSQEIADFSATNSSKQTPGTSNGHQVSGQFNLNAASLSQNFVKKSVDVGTVAGMSNHGHDSQEVADLLFA